MPGAKVRVVGDVDGSPWRVVVMVVVLASCGDYASVWDSTSLSSGASYAEIFDSQVNVVVYPCLIMTYG